MGKFRSRSNKQWKRVGHNHIIKREKIKADNTNNRMENKN